jgi:hypothetical protein
VQKLFRDIPRDHGDIGSSKQTIFTPAPTRPLLVDKTPFPNRVGPPASSFITPHNKLLLEEEPPFTILRPSSTRRKSRAPRSAGGGANTGFQTPTATGPHLYGDASVEIKLGTGDVSSQEEEDGDIEYMPPTAICSSSLPPSSSARSLTPGFENKSPGIRTPV